MSFKLFALLTLATFAGCNHSIGEIPPIDTWSPATDLEFHNFYNKPIDLTPVNR